MEQMVHNTLFGWGCSIKSYRFRTIVERTGSIAVELVVEKEYTFLPSSRAR
jgi:hypothetical protein